MTIATPLFARSGRTGRSRAALPGSAGQPTAARRYANDLGDHRRTACTPRDVIGRGPRIDQREDRTHRPWDCSQSLAAPHGYPWHALAGEEAS